MFRFHARSHSAAFVVAVTVGWLAFAAWTRAHDPLPADVDAPALVCPDTVRSNDGLYGTATDPNPPLTVSATIGGSLLGGVDATQDGNVNTFCFPTTGLAPGTWIVVTAIDGNGHLSYKFVKVTL